MVASWSVDRLGRSLTDLLSILQGLHEKGVFCCCTSKGSIRRLRAKRCFKCSACLQSSSEGSSENELMPDPRYGDRNEASPASGQSAC
jgi:hypothetical protein